MTGDLTTFDVFTERATGGRRVVPVMKTLVFDTDTPVGLYLKLRESADHSFLFESVEGGRTLGRYSIIGIDPVSIVRIMNGAIDLQTIRPEGSVFKKISLSTSDPLDVLRSLTNAVKTSPVEGMPRFSGGWVGYFGYDSIRFIENIPFQSAGEDDLPDVMLALFTDVLVADNVSRTVTIISNAIMPDGSDANDALTSVYTRTVKRIEAIETQLHGPLPDQASRPAHGRLVNETPERSQYEGWVEKAREYIEAGDIFQVVLSRHRTIELDGDPFAVYRSLRRINPSPYMYYIALNDLQVIGSSPEMLVRVEHGTVETRPIAGTRPRGSDEEADESIGRELRDDPKEKAEHLMLVDLARNDLGKICLPGSVHVRDFMSVERYSHVMHLCSTVSGTLQKEWGPVDALYACFPAGTLSGAPKVRAMQIISELEQDRRGVYGGAIGYIDFSGNLDTCIAIRTIVARRGQYRLRAGAGIVHDSVPEREFHETIDKMAALTDAMKQSGWREDDK